jgi:D-hexose-6-phosphate mutarotase
VFCSLVYIVTLASHQLSTDLHVTNTGREAFEFQALFHTYILAPSNQVVVSPLSGLQYYDKVTNEAKTESRNLVDVKNFTDSVYENAPGTYHLKWADGGLEVKTREFKDVVVWNPQETGANMGDMEDGGWLVSLLHRSFFSCRLRSSQVQVHLRGAWLRPRLCNHSARLALDWTASPFGVYHSQ